MKCKTCNFRARKTTPICWTQFGQCGNCAFRDHPEAFQRTVVKTRTEKQSFGICPSCGNRMSRLRAYRNNAMRKIEGDFCFDCKFMNLHDKGIKVEQ